MQGKNKLLMVADSFEMKAPPSLSHEKSDKKMKKQPKIEMVSA